MPINCVLVTDGGSDESVNDNIITHFESITPFSFGGTLSILCINHIDNPAFVKRFKSTNEKLIQRSGLEGE